MAALMHRFTMFGVVVGATFALAIPGFAQVQRDGETFWSAEDSMWSGNVGEDYVVEVTGGMWNPSPTIVTSSEQFGIIGTEIDFGKDLGMIRRRHNELRLHYLPMVYRQSAVLERSLVFQGIAYDIGLPVDSAITWNAWRFGYEFDVVVRDRGFLGLIVEAKYTDIQAELDSTIGREYTRARAPIPAIGAIGRMYITRFTPVTAEFTAFRLPDSVVEDYSAKYIDFDVYGTVNLTRMVGVNVGYRSMDLSYLFDRDSGTLKLGGMYFSGVFRF